MSEMNTTNKRSRETRRPIKSRLQFERRRFLFREESKRVKENTKRFRRFVSTI